MLEGGVAVPMYLQLKTTLLSQIRSGRYRRDKRLPSEPELCRRYGVSRITVRRAIQELVDEGYVVKRQGKGTFVCGHTIDRKIAYVSGFTESAEQAGFAVSSTLLKREVIQVPGRITRLLGLPDGAPVLYTQRKRMADERPVMLENNYFPLPKFDFLRRSDLSGSLYRLLGSERGIDPIHPRETSICMALADEKMANTMDVVVGTPFFKVDTFICDQHDEPVHVGHQFFLGELYTFKI